MVLRILYTCNGRCRLYDNALPEGECQEGKRTLFVAMRILFNRHEMIINVQVTET
jgi:hypothetical protein